MKVLELLDEIEEIIDSASTVPVVRKVMVDPNEISEIVKEIRLMLPDEISNAQLIINEKNRVLEDAKKECERIIQEAQVKADQLVEQDEITLKAKNKAEKIISSANENSTVMQLGVLNYVDQTLVSFQEKIDEMYATYFTDMYDDLQNTFEKINGNIASSRNEIKEKIYKAQSGYEEE